MLRSVRVAAFLLALAPAMALRGESIDGRDRGIVFQGRTKLAHGSKFQKWSSVEVLPGYKRAVDLVPGDVYVVLPAVTFRLPAQ